MEIATVRRALNHTLIELKRAIEGHKVAVAADLYALAWQQAAGAPPSDTREQRAQLQVYKKVLGSQSWREEERRQAGRVSAKSPQQPERPAIPPPRSKGDQRRRPQSSPRAPVRSSTGSDALEKVTEQARSSRTRSTPPVAERQQPYRSAEREQALLDAGQLLEISTELRPLLEQIARDGATATWSLIRKRLKDLPRLHRDDQCVVLWLVDEDRRKGEPLLSALVTVGDRQMHPRYPAIAEQHGIPIGSGAPQQRTAWSYEVLKAHQYWRHR